MSAANSGENLLCSFNALKYFYFSKPDKTHNVITQIHHYLGRCWEGKGKLLAQAFHLSS